MLPVSLVLAVGLVLQWQAHERIANQRLLAAANETAIRVDAFIASTQAAIDVEAQLPALVDYLRFPFEERPVYLTRQAQGVLQTLNQKNAVQIISYALIDTQGINQLDTEAAHQGESLKTQDYFVVPRQTLKPFVSAVHFVELEHGPTLDFSSPVEDSAGNFIGILRVRYSAAILQSIIANDSNLGGNRAFAILLDEHTIQLAHGRDASQLFKMLAPMDIAELGYLQIEGRLPPGPLTHLSTKQPDFVAGLERAATQPVFTVPLTDEVGVFIPHQLAVSSLTTQPWQVVFAQPREVFLAPLIVQAQVLLGLAVALIALVVVAALGAARWLAGPIVRLTAVAARVSQGDLTAQMPAESRDEIGTLAATFNYMLAQVRELIASLEARVRELQDAEAEIRRLNTVLEQGVRDRTLELEAANKELESFSYSISHDLRAPLRAMIGYASLLITEHSAVLNSEGRRYLSLIQTNTQQMSRLLEALVLFVSLGRKPLRSETLQPADLARQALEDLAPERAQRQVDVTITEMPDCQGDPLLLKQVYFHLLSNALKFTRKRATARIWVGSQPMSDSQRPVYFVRDNGVGFDMRYAHKLFGVFQRLHSPEEYEGTGAGLAIIQRILRRHGGQIWAEAEIDQGATFYFTL